MKKILLITALTVVCAKSYAGLSSFDSSEFNSIISQNAQTEKDLQNQLQKNTHVVKQENDQNQAEKLAAKGNLDKTYAVGTEENIIAPTPKDWYNDHKKVIGKDTLKREDSRLKKEIREASAESNL